VFLPKHLQKTPAGLSSGVFFRLLFCIAVPVLLAPKAWADCEVAGRRELVTLTSVHDGDTLRLKDGRRVRVIGINAPEEASQGRPAEALAASATQFARRFLGREISLVYGREGKDRYGRILAHVYSKEGRNLAAAMLQEGLAFPVAVPPNLAVADCFAARANEAQRAGKGVWNHRAWRAADVKSLKTDATGFQRIRGKITKISGNRDIWLEMDGAVVLKIAAADRGYFAQQQWSAWRGRTIEVQGWVVRRPEAVRKGFKPLQLQIRTPYAVTLLDD
jgi:micrococcal nuclease